MMGNWPEKKRISVVVDTPGWFDDHAERLVAMLISDGHDAEFIRTHEEVRNGDIAFYLACLKITPREILDRNTWNLVVHESDLPKGRGFAPLTWAILEGQNDITVSMIVANDGEVDSGPIVMQRKLQFTGMELNPEIRTKQAELTLEMCRDVAQSPTEPAPVSQTGTPTFLSRRRPKDSQLDVNKTILDQFDLLRVVDNERYPAFFIIDGCRYKLKIYHDTESGGENDEK